MKSFQLQMNEICRGIEDDAERVIEVEAPKVARKAVRLLHDVSPKSRFGSRSGRYAKGWTSVTEYGETTIYNRTDWQLTHLLEDGHDVYNRFGGAFGHWGGIKHIEKAEELVVQEMPMKVLRGLK